MPTAIEAKAGEFSLRHQAILRLMEKKGPDGAPDLSEDEYKDYLRYKQEADGLGAELQRLCQMEEDARASRKALEDLGAVHRPGTFGGGLARLGGDGAALRPSYADSNELLVKTISSHPQFKDLIGTSSNFRMFVPDVDIKATMTTASGFPPQVIRTGLVVPFPARRPVVGDLIPQDTTDQIGIAYVEQTGFTNGAAPVAEGALKPESGIAFTPRQVGVEVVATHIPVTEQQLRSAPAIEAIIRNSLALFVMLAEEMQLLNGSGTSPQLTGIMTRPGLQTLVGGATANLRIDAIGRAMDLIQSTTFRTATGIVIHPTDWMGIRQAKDTMGNYLFGGPQGDTPNVMWGVPVVPTTAMTAGVQLVGDFRTSATIGRQLGLTIDVGWMNDDFGRNIRRLRAETALGLAVTVPAAFCTISAT